MTLTPNLPARIPTLEQKRSEREYADAEARYLAREEGKAAARRALRRDVKKQRDAAFTRGVFVGILGMLLLILVVYASHDATWRIGG